MGDNLNKPPEGGSLTLTQRKRIVEEAKTLGARVVAMPGEGEPLAVRGTRELVDHIDALGMITIIYTKGLLLTRKWSDFLAARKVTVVLSIDSLDESTAIAHNPKPPGWFPKAMKNIEFTRGVFRPLLARIGLLRITRLVVNHMVNRLNLGHQEALRDWCGDDILFVCHGPSREGWAMDIWHELVGSAEIHRELVSRANQLSETDGNTTARSDGKCAYYLNGITIGANGDVKVCPASTQSSGRIGSIRESSLEEIHSRIQRLFGQIFGDNSPPCFVRSDSYQQLLDKMSCRSPDAGGIVELKIHGRAKDIAHLETV